MGIQPGASDSVQNGFAPPLEVIGGTDGCYMKQFQLDQFLDHLTVIIKSQYEERQTVRKRISVDKKSKGQSGMVNSIASSLGHQILYRMDSCHRWRLSEALFLTVPLTFYHPH